MEYINQFEELQCWQFARSFKNKVFKISKNFPASETYGLRSQILRSSSSVTANIAEGVGRFLPKATIQFLRQSRGSLYETLDHLYTAFDFDYIDKTTLDELISEQNNVCRVLNGYIKYHESRVTKIQK